MQLQPPLWSRKFLALILLIWAVPSALALAVSITNAILSNMKLGIVIAQGTQDFRCEFKVPEANALDEPTPQCHVPVAGTLTEIGCINKAAIVSGIADAGGSGTVLIDNGVGDFAIMGIDTSDIIRNLTKGENCTVTVIDGLTGDASNDITCGGLATQSFATGDEYEIVFNDTGIDVKLYKTGTNGWRQTTQFGDTLSVSGGRTVDSTQTGSPTVSAGDNLEIKATPTGAEASYFLFCWAQFTPS